MSLTYAHEPQTIEEFAWLIDAEYREMPGMRLTFAQVCRLWNLSAEECGKVLDYLLKSGVLTRDEENRYCRTENTY